MIDLKDAYEKALNESEEKNLSEAYENDEIYMFLFAPEQAEEMDDCSFISINKETGELGEIFGPEIGKQISTSKELSLEEIKGLSLF